MKISLPLLLVSWLAVAGSERLGSLLSSEHVFPANAETTYKWSTEVSTGVTIPGSNDNHASYFAFNGNLRVRTDATNKVLFKIEDMTYSAYNGPVKENKSPKEEHIFVKKCKDCGTIFAAVYKRGMIADIELNEADELFVRNMKRAILSQFQLDFEHLPSEQAFINIEHGVSGVCRIEQSVDFHQDYALLRKFFNNNNCSSRPARYENPTFNQCGQSTKNPVSHTTERNYKLDKTGKLFVKTIKSRSDIITQPHGLDTETYFHVTTQNVEIDRLNTAHGIEWTTGKTISTSLLFEFPQETPETGEDVDMSFGKILHDPKITVNKTMLILKQLGDHLKSTENLNPEQLHAFDMKREIATGFLRRMNTETLKLFAELIVNTDDKVTRNLALEALPRIGTLASARVVMGLKNKVTNKAFERIMLEMPFNLKHHSPEFLRVYKELMKNGSASEILAYSAVVGEVCEKSNCPDVLNIVKTFFEKMQASEDYGTKLLYLQALGNIHLDPVAKYLEPIIRDKVNYPHTLRFAAVWAAHHTHVTRPEKAYTLYWPILQDKTEHHDMRQAALIVLLYSNPTTERFLNLLSYINTIEDPDLYNMFYTTVQSLFKTKHPCFKQLSISVEEVLRIMPKRKVPSAASFNMISDYEDSDSGNGNKFQTVMISDINTGLPSVVFIDAVPHYNGIVGNGMSLHLRMDGIREAIVGKWISLNESGQSKNIFLRQFLESLGVSARKHIPTHIEIIVKRNGRTVFCEYLDQFNLHEIQNLLQRILDTWVEEIQDTPSIAVTVNSQNLDHSNTFETVLVNDVGIPVTIFMKQPGLLSLIGDIKLLPEGRKSSLLTNLSLRHLRQHTHGIYCLNPIMGLWHGVSRSRSEDLHLQLENTYSLMENPTGGIFALEWKNDVVPLTALNHVNTMTYLKGDGNEFGSLAVTCPKCEIYHIVSSKASQNVSQTKTIGSQFQFQHEVFDCEHPEELENKEKIYNAFFSSENKNIRSAVWMKPLLGLIELFDLYDRTPATGSCGQSMRIVTIGKASKFEVDLSKKKLIIFHIEDTLGNTLKSWNVDVNFNSTTKNMTDYTNIILQLRNEDAMTCIQANYEAERFEDFELLYEPSIRSDKLNFEFNFGQSQDGKCPTEENRSQILISSTSSWDKMENENFVRCEEDRGKNRVYPATENCIHTFTDYRNTPNITVNVKTKNMNTELSKHGKSLVTAIHRMLPETVPEHLPSEFSVDMRFNGDGKVALWMTGAEIPGKWHDVMEQYRWMKNILDRSFNIRERFESCYAAGENVYTFDGTSVKYNAVAKWTLLTAHCGDVPTFAVFTRKTEGTDMLALRFHVLDNVVEVTPTESESIITVNGTPYESLNETSRLDHLLGFEDGMLYLTGARLEAPVIVDFSNKFVAVRIFYDFAGWTCGLCGDFNQWPEMSHNFPGPDGKPVNLEDVTRVYTLP